MSKAALMSGTQARAVQILLIEDSPSDTQLTVEALREAKVGNHLSTVEDGLQAMRFLRREGPYKDAPRPDLIMLDLNLPCKDGREVLTEIKSDEDLKTIPVVVLTTSRAEQDVLRSYELSANCYITKPVGFEEFIEVVRSIESFWLLVVSLPSKINCADELAATEPKNEAKVTSPEGQGLRT
jgi:two-component system, chemotaxis family, response regulator Rcp1